MANAYSTSDLIKGVLQKCGEVTDGNSPYHELALKYLNIVYAGILSGSNEFAPDVGHGWRWDRSTASFILKGFYNTGTVSLTNGSVNGTFSTAPAVSQAGRFLKVTDRASYYEIATHTAGMTAFTIGSSYVEATGSGLSYLSLPIRYDLVASAGLPRGILRLIEPFRIYEDRELEFMDDDRSSGRIFGLDIDSFRDSWPLRHIESGVPTKFATDTRSESAWYVYINKYPINDMKVDFDYIEIPEDLVDSTSSIPVLPREFRVALEYGASHYLLVDKEEEKKAAYYFNLTKAKLEALHKADDKNDQLTSSTYGKLIPRQDDLNSRWWRLGR